MYHKGEYIILKKLIDKISRRYLIIDSFVLLAITICVYFLIDYNLTMQDRRQEEFVTAQKVEEVEKVIPPVKKDILDSFINTNEPILKFWANTYEINYTYLRNQIIINNCDNMTSFNSQDIFNTGNTYPSVDNDVYNYLYSLEISNPELFGNSGTGCNQSNDYVLGLVDYYSLLYPNVDTSIAKAIIEVESGFSSSYMYSKNNLFGIMGYGGLIKYKNINYGVLKFMQYLDGNYFSQGINTVAGIGYSYNPVVNNGVKSANPNWVGKITNAMGRYQEKKVNSLNDLLPLAK
jgi:hypothetical protein